MIKKVLAVLFAIMMLAGILVSCGEEAVTSNDSSTVASTEDVSSEKEESSSSKKSSSSNKTQSVSSEKEDEKDETSSSKKGNVRGEEEDVSSETESTSIKVFKNNNTVQINCYHFSIGNCEALGEEEDDKIAEFKAVVEAGYFNSYLLGMGKNLIKEVPIIAENGGTFWCFAPKFAADASGVDYAIDSYIEDCKFYINWMKENGYYELFNGFHWDEPAANDNFLKLTERLYKEFGLRQYPVFACMQFMNYEGNQGEAGFVDMSGGILNPKTAKYITDVGYDSYATDVREGAPNGNKYGEWQQQISPNIVDGKSYFVEIRKILQNQMGRPANFWHYSTAYRCYLWGGLTGMYSDEAYCIANLEFLTEDLLAQEYQGGITLYTFANFHGEHTGFECYCDAKVNGNPICTENKKWNTYCDLLRETRKKFDNMKAPLAKIVY